MAITEHDVNRIARLAGLELTPDQTSTKQSELDGMLALIEPLLTVDTDGVAPMAHPLSDYVDVTLRLRDDIARPTATPAERDALMANAPAATDGLFLVPTVIE